MKLNQRFQFRLNDIRIWIFVFFVIRMVGITNPPLETGHNWRQCLTNMMARNFYDGRANILYPEIDYAGNNSGIIGSEFPLFNYLIYLTSLAFDYSHWYGRLINLIVSSFGIYFFFLLIRKLTSEKIAFLASIVLLSSIWFAFSRKIMPDTFSVSLVLIGLYCCHKYLYSGKWIQLILFFLLTTLGGLCKIPSLYLLSALSILIFIPGLDGYRKAYVIVVTSICIGVVALWYFYWVPYLLATYHNQLYFPRGIIEGFKEIVPLANRFFRNFYFNALNSYIAFICCLVGAYLVISGHGKYRREILLVLTFTFFVFILKTGEVFPLHNYYVIPFVPVMAVLAGIAIDRIPIKFQAMLLLLIVAEGILNQQHDFFIRKNQRNVMLLESLADQFTDKKDLIVINGGQSPQEIYFTHRKGWSVNNDKINPNLLLQFKNAGAAYLIINHKTFNDSLTYLHPLGNMEEYSIYSLKE